MNAKGRNKSTTRTEKVNFSICIDKELADWLGRNACELNVSRSRFLAEIVRRSKADGAEGESVRKELRSTVDELNKLKSKYGRLAKATKDLSAAGEKLLTANDKLIKENDALVDENGRLKQTICHFAQKTSPYDDRKYFRKGWKTSRKEEPVDDDEDGDDDEEGGVVR